MKKDLTLKHFAMFIIIVLLGAIVISAIESAYRNSQWNGGYCANDNTRWEYSNATHIRNRGTVVYYYCPTCGAVIEYNN